VSARGAGLVLLLAFLPSGLAAQDVPPASELPDSVALRIAALYNAPGTSRLHGVARIATGTTIAGDVAAVGGPVTLGGRIEGELTVINGDLRIERGAVVTGGVTVVGGALLGASGALIGGGVQHFAEPLRYRQDGDVLIVVTAPLRPALAPGRQFRFGRTELLIAVRDGYNRVEGLPISIGPRLRLGSTNPTTLEGVVIYRSAHGFDLDDDALGYALHAEQYVGGGRTTRMGLRLFSEIVPIERWGLSDRENSLATFLLHRDYRDEYERSGWSGYVRFARPGQPHDLTVEYRDERHRAVAPEQPFTLLDNGDPWRAEPLVAEGTLRSLTGRYGYDTRNDPADPAAGWLVRAEVEQGQGGSLVQPGSVLFDAPESSRAQVQARERFTLVQLDVRRYLRVSPYARVALRFFASGSVDGTALPPQRQQTLGGEGSLPGYPLFRFDCGARADRVVLRGRDFFQAYGCDRAAMVQAEFHAGFPFGRRVGRALGLDTELGAIRWVAFLDAGRAWTEFGARNGRTDEDFAADAGLGVRMGAVGIYWAAPLSRDADGANFFVRVGRRF
jgi:Omp85 superfamily domain